MARIYTTIPGAQDPRYGISHANITDKLTKENYFDKAIVRGSDYIWIKKADKGVNRKETTTVYLTCFLRSDKNDEEFSALNEAIDFANKWDEEEGEYPLEYEAPWTIHWSPFRNKK